MKGSSETRDGLLQRLMFLLNDDRMRPILCGNNSVQWGKLIKEGKSFIIDCFGMGSDKFIFTGALITQGIKNYFRTERLSKYPPVVLYYDEFQNFINHNFFDILKEGRKYNVSGVFSTQDLVTLGRQLSGVVLNCGNIICFRTGHSEACIIGNETGIDPQTIQFLDKYHAVYKTDNHVGIVKATRPPIARKMEPTARPKRKSKKGWFPLESYQRA